MRYDTIEFVKKCDKCQCFANIVQAPTLQMTPINYPVPFAQWGMDLFKSMPLALGGWKWVVVTIDYFTKQVEAEPLAAITQLKIANFIQKNIIYRFGFLWVIVTDNGLQLINK